MCLLNGDVGGTFNAETSIDVERIQKEDGTWVDEKRPMCTMQSMGLVRRWTLPPAWRQRRNATLQLSHPMQRKVSH